MKILLIPFFAVSFFTAANAALVEQCTYESGDFWIKLVHLCEEGDVSCDKVVYIGLNKKTGDYVALTGKSVNSKSNYNFLYYEFINNDTKYMITRNNDLEIIKNNQLILSQKLKLCIED